MTDVDPTAPPLAFVILAHHAPDQVAELATCLATAATDAQVWIHWDLTASRSVPAELVELTETQQRVHLVRRRVRCRWGGFGLVQAPINALTEIRDSGFEPAFVALLSGSCLPNRPIAELERYLAERPGRDFIELHDDSWMVDGWRAERWQYRWWFDHKTQELLERYSYRLQRGLGLRRRFPAGLTPRFGSQWWTLSWATCTAILDDIAAHPRRFRFFRNVWIPDELVIQTYAYALGGPTQSVGFGLTHFQFTDRGKPVVYFDDHADFVPVLESFFVRKVASSAHRLRERLLAIAASPDTGRSLRAIGTSHDEYDLSFRAQTHLPRPGQIFFRSQASDMPSEQLASCTDPYVVLVGPSEVTAALAERLAGGPFTVLGEVFDHEIVDFGGVEVPGLASQDAKIRDLDPANYLVRVRQRCAGVPVIRLGLHNSTSMVQTILADRSALVVACVPYVGAGSGASSETLMRLSGAIDADLPATMAWNALATEALTRTWFERVFWSAHDSGKDAPSWLPWLMIEAAANDWWWVRSGCIVCAWGLRVPGPGARIDPIFGPLMDRPTADADRAAALDVSIVNNPFVDHEWFPDLVAAVRDHAKFTSAGLMPFPAVLTEAVESVFGTDGRA